MPKVDHRAWVLLPCHLRASPRGSHEYELYLEAGERRAKLLVSADSPDLELDYDPETWQLRPSARIRAQITKSLSKDRVRVRLETLTMPHFLDLRLDSGAGRLRRPALFSHPHSLGSSSRVS